MASVATPATAGFAQDTGNNGNTQQNRLEQLENQVQTLSRTVYRGEAPPAAAAQQGGVPTSALSNYDARMSDLESQQRNLTGQIEELNHQIIQLKDRLEKLTADYDQRLQALEGHGAASATGASSGASSGAKGAADMLPAEKHDTSSPTPPSTSGTLGTLPTGKGGGDPANALYESAFADVRDANYGAAEAKLKEFMKTYSDHALAGNAQYWLAETYYVRGDYKQAAKAFAQCYQDYPKSAKTPDSLLKLGLSLSKLGKKDDACISLQQLKKQFPGEQSAVVARANQEIKTLGCK